MSPSDAELRTGMPLPKADSILELVSIANTPKLDWLSDSDPFLVACVRDRWGRLKCGKRSWPYCLNSNSPVFRQRRVLNAPLGLREGSHPSDTLVLQVYDYDDSIIENFCGLDLIGTAKITVAEIEAYGCASQITLPLLLSQASRRALRQSKATSCRADKDIGRIEPPEDMTGRARPSVVDVQESLPKDSRCSVTFRAFPASVHQSWPVVKWLFLVRHGESAWNEAERNRDLGTMLDTDHTLSTNGVAQCLALDQKIWERLSAGPRRGTLEAAQFGASPGPPQTDGDDVPGRVYDIFFGAERIFASPLTRALQTALLTMQRHPRALRDGIELRHEVREVKNLTGLDTVSHSQGSQIPKRAKSQLPKLLDTHFGSPWGVQEVLHRVQSIRVDPCNTEHEWWTGVRDSAAEVRGRTDEFLSQMKLSPYRSNVIVGHSLFFREVCGTYLAEQWCDQHPDLAAKLRGHKMPNCGVVALRVDFARPMECCVTEAHLLFGTELIKAKDSDKKDEMARDDSKKKLAMTEREHDSAMGNAPSARPRAASLDRSFDGSQARTLILHQGSGDIDYDFSAPSKASRHTYAAPNEQFPLAAGWGAAGGLGAGALLDASALDASQFAVQVRQPSQHHGNWLLPQSGNRQQPSIGQQLGPSSPPRNGSAASSQWMPGQAPGTLLQSSPHVQYQGLDPWHHPPQQEFQGLEQQRIAQQMAGQSLQTSMSSSMNASMQTRGDPHAHSISQWSGQRKEETHTHY